MILEGRYDEVEEQRMEKDLIAFKNTFLIPIYTSVKAIASKLKKSELDNIYEEFQVTLYGLEQTFGKDSIDFKNKKVQAETLYLQLLKKVKMDMDQPKNRLFILREQSILIVNLLIKWREYTKILKMSFSATKKMKEESQTKTKTVKDNMPSKEKTKEIVDAKYKEFISGNEEFDIENVLKKKEYVLDENETDNISDFFQDYKDVINPFISKDQIDEIEKDFLRIKEDKNSIYGQLRQQPEVTSDEFFKNLMKENKNGKSQNVSEEKSGVENIHSIEKPENNFFNLLNLVYESVI